MKEEAIDYLFGLNGDLFLYKDRIIIQRNGLMAKVMQGFNKGDKTIYLDQISSIQVKLGGFITNGYIQFSIPGGNESTKGLWSATQDENSVTFEKSDNPVVEQIKAKIEELQRAMKNSGGMVIQNTVSTADEIKKFKELMDQGIITTDEYEAKKKQLLNI